MKFRSIAAVVFGMFFMFISSARADERSTQEVGVQGTGFFTKDSNSNVLNQHTTNSGGFLVSYRYHFNRWFAADVSYGWNRDTQQNNSSGGSLNVQSNVHQTTVAAVVNLPGAWQDLTHTFSRAPVRWCLLRPRVRERPFRARETRRKPPSSMAAALITTTPSTLHSAWSIVGWFMDVQTSA